MTVNELIGKLNALPEEQKEMELLIWTGLDRDKAQVAILKFVECMRIFGKVHLRFEEVKISPNQFPKKLTRPAREIHSRKPITDAKTV